MPPASKNDRPRCRRDKSKIIYKEERLEATDGMLEYLWEFALECELGAPISESSRTSKGLSISTKYSESVVSSTLATSMADMQVKKDTVVPIFDSAKSQRFSTRRQMIVNPRADPSEETHLNQIQDEYPNDYNIKKESL